MDENFAGARSVVVAVDYGDGINRVWRINNPTQARWDFIGSPAGSTHARITVSGEFERMARYDERTFDDPNAGELEQ